MSEALEVRLKRLKMRSWRRGIKEMDLILGIYADDCLRRLDEATLALYDQLLSENDHDLYLWVSGQAEPPPRFERLIADIARHAGGSFRIRPA
ncbi:MAG: succinate dehydrogenase assembly factor 2 [Tranquillimonas sp.]|jgi:antitoxin CptB